ncbi:TIGR04551 family protein [Hyalangium sp.]|uniref:TIGR04551 family protein n=1 Tax=Hyalangium sp. TaxID=2028555 RepID=UPI002D2AF831|nr:TIGR04551 family protein [Hyalangium sp.]HYH97358.1 TIGR04551 family protein [Hyalangium sp.]
MSHVLLAALLVASATATAQTSPKKTPVPESGTPASAQPAPASPTPLAQAAPAAEKPAATPPAQPATAQPAPAAGGTAAAPEGELTPEMQRELDRRLEAAKQEMREEIRAQMATQSLSSDWQQEWTEEKRKLEIFTLDGYFRVRPNLFYKFDLGKDRDLALFPSRSETENTQAGANMRVRLEPTFNVSEEVRLKLQLDLLDNFLLGSTPDLTLDSGRNQFAIFSESQDGSAVDALRDTLSVKRAYGEVSTPVGILRFGRMGSHWGLGMLRNDGNCLDCDFGDNVDRVQFVTEPFSGFYVTPMIDFNAEGTTSQERTGDAQREAFDVSNADDSHSYVLAIARRDTDQQVKDKLENNQGVLNYGLHFTYRTQRWEAFPRQDDPNTIDTDESSVADFVPRDATLYVPDLWLRYEERLFRVEVELAAIYGSINNRALNVNDVNNPAQNQSLRVLQFGGVAQGEYKLLNGDLHLGLELGFASGDKAAGFGQYQRGRVVNPDGEQVDGPQYSCGVGGCADNAIRNFRFNRAYRVDLILWREIIGGLTDAAYIKPSMKYSLADGFDLYGGVIYSQALYAESTPSTTSRSLGVEVDVGARYETEDGFVAGLNWGIFFPMGGLQEPEGSLFRREFETAQAIRGTLAIRF